MLTRLDSHKAEKILASLAELTIAFDRHVAIRSLVTARQQPIAARSLTHRLTGHLRQSTKRPHRYLLDMKLSAKLVHVIDLKVGDEPELLYLPG